MPSITVKGKVNAGYLQEIIDITTEGWDDPEIGPDIRLNPVDELETYLDANSVKVRETEYSKEFTDRIDIMSQNTRSLVYKLGGATVFVMHTEYRTDWPPLANPETESVRIRVYGNGKDVVLANLKQKLALFPELSQQ